jgi:hypothetical protein
LGFGWLNCHHDPKSGSSECESPKLPETPPNVLRM